MTRRRGVSRNLSGEAVGVTSGQRSLSELIFPADYYPELRAMSVDLSQPSWTSLWWGRSWLTLPRLQHFWIIKAIHLPRRITSNQFYHQGHRVCLHTLPLFVHSIGLKTFINIKSSYLKDSPVLRVHGNTGEKTKYPLNLQQIKDVWQQNES